MKCLNHLQEPSSATRMPSRGPNLLKMPVQRPLEPSRQPPRGTLLPCYYLQTGFSRRPIAALSNHPKTTGSTPQHPLGWQHMATGYYGSLRRHRRELRALIFGAIGCSTVLHKFTYTEADRPSLRSPSLEPHPHPFTVGAQTQRGGILRQFL